MKQLKTYKWRFVAVALLLAGFVACNDDDSVKQPTADFEYQVDAPAASFQSLSENAVFLEWDFGDGATSTDAYPTHTFKTWGDHEVTLKAISGVTDVVKEGGDVVEFLADTVTTTQTVTIDVPDYDSGVIDMNNWSLMVTSEGVTVTTSDSAFNFSGVGGDNWPMSIIYQEVTVEAGTYQLSGFITVNSVIDEVWCEWAFADAAPTGDFGGPFDFQYSTWNGSSKDQGIYSLEDINTSGDFHEGGLYTFDAPQTFYIVIKSGSHNAYDMTCNYVSFKKVD